MGLMAGTALKLQRPNPKLQRSSKDQNPSAFPRFPGGWRRFDGQAASEVGSANASFPDVLTGTGSLEVGIFLDLGSWLLELPLELSCGRAARAPAGKDRFKMRPAPP